MTSEHITEGSVGHMHLVTRVRTWASLHIAHVCGLSQEYHSLLGCFQISGGFSMENERSYVKLQENETS